MPSEKANSIQNLAIQAVQNTKQMNDFLEFKDMPREIKKWRKKVKQALPEKYFYEFENLPKEKDCQGTLRNFLLDFHTHSLEVLAQAAKGK